MRTFLSVSALVLCVSSFASAIVIDDFTVGPISLLRNASVAVSQVQTGLDPAHVLGGQRDIVLGQFYDNPQTFEINSTTSQMTLTNGGPTKLAGVDIYYGSLVAPLNVDLTAGGHNRFVLDFDGNNPGSSWIRVTSLNGAIATERTVSMSAFYDGNVSTIPFTALNGVDLRM